MDNSVFRNVTGHKLVVPHLCVIPVRCSRDLLPQCFDENVEKMRGGDARRLRSCRGGRWDERVRGESQAEEP